jgi:hypothetical protein
VQPPGRNAPSNRLMREPEPLFKLANGDHPVLLPSQPGQPSFPLPSLRSTYGPARDPRSSFGPVTGRRVDRTLGAGP